MLLVAVALFISTSLVQNNQENRSYAVAYRQLGQSCTYTSSCQPPMKCVSGKCKKETIVRTGTKGLNQSCSSDSNCKSPYVCYSGVCKSRSGGECKSNSDCYANHYCSASNHHCKSDTVYKEDKAGSVDGTKTSTLDSTAKPTTTATSQPAATTTSQPTTVTTTVATTTPVESKKINFSFLISLSGVKSNAFCINQLGSFDLELVNNLKSLVKNISNIEPKILDGRVSSKGDQVLELTVNADDTEFDLENKKNYLLIDNKNFLNRKMCSDKQSEKSNTNDCDIDFLSGKNYDFSEYALLNGDVNNDGMVNGYDFSLIKNNFNFNNEISCGKTGDLNFDGEINSLDLASVKLTLSSIEDE